MIVLVYLARDPHLVDTWLAVPTGWLAVGWLGWLATLAVLDG